MPTYTENDIPSLIQYAEAMKKKRRPQQPFDMPPTLTPPPGMGPMSPAAAAASELNPYGLPAEQQMNTPENIRAVMLGNLNGIDPSSVPLSQAEEDQFQQQNPVQAARLAALQRVRPRGNANDLIGGVLARVAQQRQMGMQSDPMGRGGVMGEVRTGGAPTEGYVPDVERQQMLASLGPKELMERYRGQRVMGNRPVPGSSRDPLDPEMMKRRAAAMARYQSGTRSYTPGSDAARAVSAYQIRKKREEELAALEHQRAVELAQAMTPDRMPKTPVSPIEEHAATAARNLAGKSRTAAMLIGAGLPAAAWTPEHWKAIQQEIASADGVQQAPATGGGFWGSLWNFGGRKTPTEDELKAIAGRIIKGRTPGNRVVPLAGDFGPAQF